MDQDILLAVAKAYLAACNQAKFRKAGGTIYIVQYVGNARGNTYTHRAVH
ncbi:hypothetical protein ABNB59_12095 [Paenibacillus larvae]|uniref:Uncharacterized protein n=2 Tax=Paenibacillus larvae subsp. larvae TaxID=147375 RepID=V9W2N3_9BACL|nr:hypothetical protein [Paenibacillus larvae]AHD04214.1 hypothetical protein ERIC2_c03560 [Paenibacillus larvae subsp. larvae DSM 25430]AVF23910.1 hypothetical protein ERICI_04193 [Paenibacillus larvae subsp. larvae]AVG10823.1 hypothetical protein ERICII_00371 [Paenibacillus larvae subsp. larvae DSM 25430]ETK29416.1 hypothetical protein ERIC1_1c29670 [Paenibacillus larvae subsp. larvae DSM 25719]MCY7491464.1 hypothetical protein [Paenibacillus larvae]